MTRTTAHLIPTPEQIATIDPAVDWEAALAAGVTFAHRAAHTRTVPCDDEPRCRARAGEGCTTPNGWGRAAHQSRADRAYGRPARPRRPGRLTDRQAQWLEVAAETDDHRLYAAGQYGYLDGDAHDRQTADAMERAGLIEQIGVGPDCHERIFDLTDAGWSTYWTHSLVIHRGTPEHHAADCRCKTTRPEKGSPA
jgi:hypothetical protein